jgi:hypothetical protein
MTNDPMTAAALIETAADLKPGLFCYPIGVLGHQTLSR